MLALTAIMPGSDCATAVISPISSLETQPNLSQYSCSMTGIIASPPPNVTTPIFSEERKMSRIRMNFGGFFSVNAKTLPKTRYSDKIYSKYTI